MEFRAKVKVGDTALRVTHEKKRKGFPWRPILLCALRLGLCAWCLSQRSSQMVIRTDGSTSTKRPFRRSRAHYRYDEMNVMLSVVLLDMFLDRWSSVFAGGSSALLLVAVLLNLSRRTEPVQRDRYTDGDVVADTDRGYWSSLIASLTIFALCMVSLDVVEIMPTVLLNSNIIFTNVGLWEASTYLVIFITCQAFQLYLLFGGLNFQNRLFRDKIDFRPNVPGLQESKIS